ncbi:hypothetical protein MCOR04_009050 [Pyricularia oryzae]|nr:hypothetical protein MCOR13_000802 [Pyricularia oryzae]KAI6564721.1 hypothetical protein MCOR04_009050 [Pyricularia oryzae]
MEVAGLAIGIVSLYTTCRDCYSFFTAVQNADASSSTHLRELEIQQSILKAWGFHWEIQNEQTGPSEAKPSGHGTRQTQTKLRQYLSNNRFKAEGVFKTLAAIVDTLSDRNKLVKRYGIELQPAQQVTQDASQSSWTLTSQMLQLFIQDTKLEDFKPVVSEARNRLSLLNKFKWALKDRDGFKKLIADLRSHSESLYRLCPDTAFESMNIYLTMDCLATQESPAGLRWTSRLALEHANADEGSSVRDGYTLLAATATLKASVNQSRGRVEQGATDGDLVLTSIGEEHGGQLKHLGKGLALFQDQVVYVEMRDYRGPPLDLTPEQKMRLKLHGDRLRKKSKKRYPTLDPGGSETDGDSDETEDDEPIELIRPADPKLRLLITNFFNTFYGSNKMNSVYGLDIAGIVDHTQGDKKGHYSILYKLPGSIGVQTRERPAENLKLRAPVTLKSLIDMGRGNDVSSSLGARFELARKLVRAVCLLHSSGWLHKNIRAESVIFFPEHVTELQKDRYELKIKIDVSNPSLMGYIFSRPDDVPKGVHRNPSPTAEPASPRLGGGRLETDVRVWDGPFSRFSTSYQPAPRRPPIHMPGEQTKKKPKQVNVSGFTLDYYQHPAKHADPMCLYRHAYDVYSLGILLLEVGLWETLRDHYTTPGDDQDFYEQRRLICRVYLDKLRWTCGDTYADVVLNCLMVDSGDDEIAKAGERELCARIVADLEGCKA